MLQLGIVIVLCVFVVRALFGFKAAKDDDSKSTDELRAEFQRKDFLMMFLFFLLLPAFIAANTALFNFLYNWSLAGDKATVYLIKPDIGTWIVWGMMSALGFYVVIQIFCSFFLFFSN
jgi:hypothetical protein